MVTASIAGATARVAHFVVATNCRDIPRAARERGRRHVLDTLGATVAGVNHPVASILDAYLAEIGAQPHASVVGGRWRTSLRDAALANGVLGHAHDYDDTSWQYIGHPSVVVLPAALAAGERYRRSGAEVLAAYLLGVEVACKLGLATYPRLYEDGWHATGVVGVLGATVAAGKLLGLDEHLLSRALGLAVSSASGLRHNFGTMAKPFHAGHAAEGGIVAAYLAGQGFTATENALEAPEGFAATFAGGLKIDALEALGSPWSIVDPGFAFKLYPSCAGTHTAIDALLALCREHELASEMVDRIEVEVSPVVPLMLLYPQARTALEGKFSLPFVLAVALQRGRVTVAEFSDALVADPAVRGLMERVQMTVRPDLASAERTVPPPAVVHVWLRDGRHLVRRVDWPRGTPANPAGDDDLITKYRGCAEPVLGTDRTEQVRRLIAGMEDLDDVGQLMAALQPG